MKQFLISLFGITALIFQLVNSSPAKAARPFQLYAEPNISYEKIKVGSGEFKTWLAGATVGFDITDKIAVAGSFATSIKDDSLNSLTVDIDSITNLYLRYGNSVRRSYRIYYFLGQSQSKISYSGTGSPSTDTLDDLSWGIGVEERFKTYKKLFYKLEYVQHYKNGSQSLTGFNFGIRINL